MIYLFVELIFVIRNDSPVVELSVVDKTKLDDEIEQECLMTNREFWLSKHGIYLFLCFWTSILIIGKIDFDIRFKNFVYFPSRRIAKSSK